MVEIKLDELADWLSMVEGMRLVCKKCGSVNKDCPVCKGKAKYFDKDEWEVIFKIKSKEARW